MQPAIQTSAGKYFNFLAPHTYAFDIEEIAHALSNLCRFTGHTREFYSVAQHSVLVSQIAPIRWRKQGLMHDAHEAYVNDISSPLKLLLPDYCRVEASVEQALRAFFGLPQHFAPDVKHADLVALQTERLSLMPIDHSTYWNDLAGITSRPGLIKPLTSDRAFDAFMERWRLVQGDET